MEGKRLDPTEGLKLLERHAAKEMDPQTRARRRHVWIAALLCFSIVLVGYGLIAPMQYSPRAIFRELLAKKDSVLQRVESGFPKRAKVQE